MSTQAGDSKEPILAFLVSARREVMDAAAALPPEERGRVFLGQWSVRELIAHLVGWDYTNLAAARELLAGQLPAFYAEHDRDWQTYNARLVATYGRDDWAELIDSVEASHRVLVEFLRALPAAEFDRDRGVRAGRYKVTIGRLLQAEARDEVRHAAQIRAFWAGRKTA